MPGCRNLQNGRPLMLMMRSPLLSWVSEFAKRSAADAHDALSIAFRCRDFNVAEQFPIDARVLEPAKRSATDAYDALSIAFRCRDFQCCRAVSQ